MKKILAILAAAFGALFFACAPVVNGSAGFTAGTMPYKPNKNDIVEGFVIAKTADGFDKTLFTDKGIDVCGELSLTGTGFTYWYLHKDIGNEALLKSVFSIKGVLSADNDYKVASPKIVESKDIALSPFSTEPVASTQGLGDGNVLQDPVSDAESYALDITKALQAYKTVGYGDKDVVAGIIDTGINMLHEDFNAGSESVVLYAKSAKTGPASSAPPIDDGNPFTEVPLGSNWDTSGHGTHCSGIICALGDNDKGIAGVAWKKTKLISYQSLGCKGGGTAWAVYGALADLTNTVEILRKDPTTRTAEEKAKLPSYMDSNFQITQKTVPVNMSFGSSIGSEYAFSILTNALMHNVLPVIAMGNEGRYTAAYPAAFPGVLAVGATNGKDKKARFSNNGAWISVAAPGESIISCGNSTASSYVSLSGTSMAAPFVTGFISYLLSFDNAHSLTPYQLKTLIEKTADKIDGATSFDERFGHGRVNVFAAADSVKNNHNIPAANDVYGEGTVKLEVTGFGSPVNKSVCIIDKAAHTPLVYVPLNNSGKIDFKGFVKGRAYTLFVSDGTKVKQQDFTGGTSDQTITIAW
ncbi:dentilisin complex serine proteinase subunit PrtP [Treponema socranskii]|uniref:dentilisin complex serine proteinase subunit PrtP n=1 Tax=Treponema socranskii TaxID=53419 RepID=UPI003D8DF569